MPVKSLCLKENPSESVRFRRIFVKKRAIAQQKLFANATAPQEYFFRKNSSNPKGFYSVPSTMPGYSAGNCIAFSYRPFQKSSADRYPMPKPFSFCTSP